MGSSIVPEAPAPAAAEAPSTPAPAPVAAAPAPAVEMAPASPPAPAPAVVTDPTARDTPSSTALADALAQFGSGINQAMREPDPALAPPAEQPRNPDGTFASPNPEPVAPVAETPAAPVVAEPAAAPAAGEEPAAEAPTDETPAGEEPIDPALLVDIMPRHPHQAPVQIAVDSPETAELLRQSLNGAMRREEYDTAMREVEARRERVEEDAVMLRIDPVRAVSESLTPQQQQLLVLSLLGNDQLFNSLQEPLQQMVTDEMGRREVRLNVREEYSAQREVAASQVQQQRAVARNVRDLQNTVVAVTPPNLKGDAATIWQRDALRELSAVTRQHNLTTLDPMQVPTVLTARLRASGVDPSQAAATVHRLFNGPRSAASTPSAPADGAPRAANAPALPSAAPRTGTPPQGSRPVQALQASHARRAAAAATAGPGVGTPAASGLPSLPEGAGLDQAFSLVNQARGVR